MGPSTPPSQRTTRSAISPAKTMRSSNKDSLIVAVDFGTTYSGASYVYRGKPEPSGEIPDIMGWTKGNNCEKVPSELRYELTTTNVRQPGRKRQTPGSHADILVNRINAEIVEWGFDVDKEKDYTRYLKLLLDEHQQFPDYVNRRSLHDQLKRIGKTPVDAAADYLAKLRDHIFQAIDKRFDQTMSATTKFDMILTVPAVWSNAAKDATLKAADKAGLSNKHSFSMVTEPEAAALCVLKQMEGINLEIGDNYIICDAGGGTVDLISYEVQSLGPLRLEESVAGSGGICGSGLLNMRFEEHVKARMGAESFLAYCHNHLQAWNQCLQKFEEETKRDFDPSAFPDREYNLLLFGAKDNTASRIKSNKLMLVTSDLESIFHPVIESIVKLVTGQYDSLVRINKVPKGVILVSGFGESDHLHKTLKSIFAIEGFNVLRPHHAWSAVVRGAVIHALEGEDLVRSRVARYHYGVVNRRPFDASKHSLSNKTWDEDNEKWYADNQVDWYVKKGQSLPTGHTIAMPFHITAQDIMFQEVVTLVLSEEDEAPNEFKHTIRTRVLCTVNADLTHLPQNRWKSRRTATGREYLVMDYAVGMTPKSVMMKFDLRVGDRVYGTATAEYE